MNKYYFRSDLADLINALRTHEVISYPTESVFGLGCDPDSEIAVRKLLTLKRRDWKKGLILVAANHHQLNSYVDYSLLDIKQKERIMASWPGPVTWIIPAKSHKHPLLTGCFNSLAVRVSAFEPIQRLCIAWGKPLVSTSSNLTGNPPARNVVEVQQQLGVTFPIMDGVVEGRLNPSEIRYAITGELLRSG